MLANRVRMSYIKKGGIPDYYVMATDDDFSMGGYEQLIYSNWEVSHIIIPDVIKGVPVTSYTNMFTMTLVEGVASNNPNVTDMSRMFEMSQATTLDLRYLDTSNVTDMNHMFQETRATTLDLGNLDTSNVTKMNGMFINAHATTLDLSSFDTSNVTDMGYMFLMSHATTLDLSGFDTSNVTNMSGMFAESKATTLDLSSFDTSNVTNMNGMFEYSRATIGYARTQADADRFNASSGKPSNLNFIVKVEWQTVQDIVRAGNASNYFDIGDELASLYDGRGIIWQVIGIDVDTPTDSNFTHSMTIQTKDVVENRSWKEGWEPVDDNRYVGSEIQAYLNSDFLGKLDPELSAVIGQVDKKVGVSAGLGGGQDSFSDKMFLLSQKEVDLGDADAGVTTGEFIYPFYNGKGNANRIKRFDGSAKAWWLRTPFFPRFDQIRRVGSNGSLGNSAPYDTNGVSPACVII